eukprot:SAG31_NODE_1133_length_9745_cov_5.676343_3_plen_220_part_00
MHFHYTMANQVLIESSSDILRVPQPSSLRCGVHSDPRFRPPIAWGDNNSAAHCRARIRNHSPEVAPTVGHLTETPVVTCRSWIDHCNAVERLQLRLSSRVLRLSSSQLVLRKHSLLERQFLLSTQAGSSLFAFSCSRGSGVQKELFSLSPLCTFSALHSRMNQQSIEHISSCGERKKRRQYTKDHTSARSLRSARSARSACSIFEMNWIASMASIASRS